MIAHGGRNRHLRRQRRNQREPARRRFGCSTHCDTRGNPECARPSIDSGSARLRRSSRSPSPSLPAAPLPAAVQHPTTRRPRPPRPRLRPLPSPAATATRQRRVRGYSRFASKTAFSRARCSARIGTVPSAASTNVTAISPNTIGTPCASPNALMTAP